MIHESTHVFPVVGSEYATIDYGYTRKEWVLEIIFFQFHFLIIDSRCQWLLDSQKIKNANNFALYVAYLRGMKLNSGGLLEEWKAYWRCKTENPGVSHKFLQKNNK